MAIAALAAACAGGDAPLGSSPGAVALLRVAPRYATFGALAATAPINRIRMVAVDTLSGDTIAPTPLAVEVDPQRTAWDLALQLQVPTGRPVVVRVLFELVHVDAGGQEKVEWSGSTGAVSVSAQTVAQVAQASAYRGPLANLAATALRITTAPRVLLPDDELALLAEVDGGGASTRVYWSSLDPEVAAVQSTGIATAVARALAPGRARIVAEAGPVADTLALDVASWDTETRIVLRWQGPVSDLDLHLTGPLETAGRFHVFWHERGAADRPPHAMLALDDSIAPGEEVLLLARQVPGVYRLSVHDYTNRDAAPSRPSGALAAAGASVEVHRGGRLVARLVPPAGSGTLWSVLELEGLEVRPLGTLGYQSDPFAIGAASAADAASAGRRPGKGEAR